MNEAEACADCAVCPKGSYRFGCGAMKHNADDVKADWQDAQSAVSALGSGPVPSQLRDALDWITESYHARDQGTDQKQAYGTCQVCPYVANHCACSCPRQPARE